MPDLAEELLTRYDEAQCELATAIECRRHLRYARVDPELKRLTDRRDRLRAEVLKHLRS